MTVTPTVQRPVRTRVVVSDPCAVREYLEGVYGVSLRLKELRERGPTERLTHERVDVGPFAIEDVHLPGELEASPDPLGRVMAIRATSGRLRGHCDGIDSQACAGDLTMVSQADLPHYAHVEDISATVLLLNPSTVAGVATGTPARQVDTSVRFRDFRPVSSNAARLWMTTVDYVKNCLLADQEIATPLVVGHASRLLAAVTLSAFPNDAATTRSRFDRTDARPPLLRRAIEFMDSNADNDIAIADVASAIHVTPRAVQYMFRKHLNTTPLQYLRQVRLHRAHQELVSADRMHETVSAIAARWGFMHTGRFAVLYRETFNQSPHATLRS
ncbi:AraC family transcriptional regulator [Mycolicibacterium moriokaense]|nr:AraC family transcriptional regulator [Mycolicibacterium moriokaense]